MRAGAAALCGGGCGSVRGETTPADFEKPTSTRLVVVGTCHLSCRRRRRSRGLRLLATSSGLACGGSGEAGGESSERLQRQTLFQPSGPNNTAGAASPITLLAALRRRSRFCGLTPVASSAPGLCSRRWCCWELQTYLLGGEQRPPADRCLRAADQPYRVSREHRSVEDRHGADVRQSAGGAASQKRPVPSSQQVGREDLRPLKAKQRLPSRQSVGAMPLRGRLQAPIAGISLARLGGGGVLFSRTCSPPRGTAC